MIELSILAARLELIERAGPTPEYIGYVRAQGIDMLHCGLFAGACGVVSITILPDKRFEFDDSGSLAFVLEAYGEDGETVVDLVAWPVDRPAMVLTMFGRCGLVGMWEAMSPATYIMGGSLEIHETTLAWLRARCRGAAVVVPHIAARILLDLPGKMRAQSDAHGQRLKALRRSVIREGQILIPRRAA